MSGMKTFRERSLDDIRGKGTAVCSVNVKPLGFEAISELLRESLHSGGDLVGPLAEVLMRMTNGNSFFVSEFLKTLYQKELLVFQPKVGWVWVLAGIKAGLLRQGELRDDLSLLRLKYRGLD